MTAPCDSITLSVLGAPSCQSRHTLRCSGCLPAPARTWGYRVTPSRALEDSQTPSASPHNPCAAGLSCVCGGSDRRGAPPGLPQLGASLQ